MDAPRASPGLAWVGFLLMAFAIVGLVGVFATYAAPIPLAREAAREATLDAALAHVQDPQALAALRPALDDSASAVLDAPGPLPARVAAARVAMRARFQVEAAALGRRLRWLIVLITLTGAAFGTAILFAGRRG